nr:MAG TPA: hypothetical protein [Caudoviricetes sp.]
MQKSGCGDVSTTVFLSADFPVYALLCGARRYSRGKLLVASLRNVRHGGSDRDSRRRGKLTRYKSNGVTERADAVSHPAVEEILPIQALSVIVLGKLFQIRVNLEKFIINKQAQHIVQTVAERVNRYICSRDKIRILEIKRFRKGIDIQHGGDICSENKHLPRLLGKVFNTKTVVQIGREFKHVGNALDHRHNLVSVRGSRGGNSYLIIVRRVDVHKLLRAVEDITIRRAVHRVNDSANKRTHAIVTEERSIQRVILNRVLVKHFGIAAMENGVDIRNFPLVHFVFGNARIVFVSICHVHIDFFDGVAETVRSLDKLLVRISEHARREAGSGNAVDKRGYIIVLKLNGRHNRISDFFQIFVDRRRNRPLIVKTSMGANVIQYISDISHLLNPLKKFVDNFVARSRAMVYGGNMISIASFFLGLPAAPEALFKSLSFCIEFGLQSVQHVVCCIPFHNAIYLCNNFRVSAFSNKLTKRGFQLVFSHCHSRLPPF